MTATPASEPSSNTSGTDRALVVLPSVITPDVSLDDLAAVARAEHRLCETALSEAIVHAIRVGEALQAARSKVERGTWMQWVSENLDFSKTTVYRYLRVAGYRDEIEAWAVGQSSPILAEAVHYLNSLPPPPGIRRGRRPGAKDELLKQAALELHADGENPKDIAQMLGVHTSTVTLWIDPAAAERRRKSARLYTARLQAQRRAARELERIRERESVVRVGGVDKQYAALRRIALELDALLSDDERSREVKTALRSAMSNVHRAEDDLVRAARLARAD